jgi:guanylate kinase
MNNQIFKKKIPNEMLFTLFDFITKKGEKYYIINNDTYKRGLFNNKIVEFLNEIKEYYHLSKQKYIDRKLSYNSFTTILRQICNYNKINYTSQIKYDKSKYDINYYIYF